MEPPCIFLRQKNPSGYIVLEIGDWSMESFERCVTLSKDFHWLYPEDHLVAPRLQRAITGPPFGWFLSCNIAMGQTSCTLRSFLATRSSEKGIHMYPSCVSMMKWNPLVQPSSELLLNGKRSRPWLIHDQPKAARCVWADRLAQVTGPSLINAMAPWQLSSQRVCSNVDML